MEKANPSKRIIPHKRKGKVSGVWESLGFPTQNECDFVSVFEKGPFGLETGKETYETFQSAHIVTEGEKAGPEISLWVFAFRRLSCIRGNDSENKRVPALATGSRQYFGRAGRAFFQKGSP